MGLKSFRYGRVVWLNMCYSSPWIRLMRFHEYGFLTMIACLSGSLLATTELDFRLLQLMVYSVTGSISAFVINDVADAYDDAVLGRCRNPLTTGELSYGVVLTFFMVTSVISMVSLIGLCLSSFTLGLITLVTAYQYSIGFRFKDRPPADLVVHGLVPALLVLTSYTAFKPLDIDALVLGLMVFTSSCVAELLQEIRDGGVKGVVKYLGISLSKDLVLVFTLVTLVLYLVLTTMRYDLRLLMLYTPLAYFIVEPVMRFRSGVISVEEVINLLRRRATALALVVITTYVVLKLL